MNAPRTHRRSVTRTLLLVTLILAQSLVLAHEIDHFSAGDLGRCAVCQIGHGLHSPVSSTAAAQIPRCVGQPGFILPLWQEDETAWLPPQARAPPLTLSAA